MNIIGHIDPSAFRTAPRMHHRLDESTPEFPFSAGSLARGLLALKAQNWRAIGPVGEPYVETLCQTNSFWAAPLDQLGCIVAPTEPQHFAFSVDMRFDDGYNLQGDFGLFGFTKLNYMKSVSAIDLSVYAYAPGSTINSNGTRQLVTSGTRHLVTFDFDPSVGNSVDVDGSVSSEMKTTIKIPYDTSFRFGGNSGSKIVTSVVKPVRMRVYGVKIYQFHNLVADLVPYREGDVVGMVDAVSGRKFPGSNLEYGEESQ